MHFRSSGVTTAGRRHEDSNHLVYPVLCSRRRSQHARTPLILSCLFLVYSSISLFLPRCEQSTDPSDYGLFRRIPDGCDPSTNCTYFVGMEVNSDDRSYLDFIMTGEAEGWLAIGFSTSRSMVGCCSSGQRLSLLFPAARQRRGRMHRGQRWYGGSH